MAELDTSLLITKFFKPKITKDHVTRVHLYEKLTQELELPLTLVSAPAVYGKSSLVSGWLDNANVNYRYSELDRYGQTGFNYGLVTRLSFVLE